MTINLRTYNMKSRSLDNLRPAGCRPFGGKTNSRNMGRGFTRTDFVVNWGGRQPIEDTMIDRSGGWDILNPPENIVTWQDKGLCADYVNSREELKDLFIEQTRDKSVAQGWLDSGSAVVCRSVLNGSNGVGITLVDPEGELPDVPLYSKYFKKRNEYRVHAGVLPTGGVEIIAAQRKAMRRDAEYADTRIRNAHDTGAGSWVFLGTPTGDLPQAVADTVNSFLTSVVDMGLDFGGFDVAYNEYHNKARIIEINTAPGLGETDAQKYVEYFKKFELEEV